MTACKPKRTQFEWIALIASFLAASITIAGKLNFLSIGLTTATTSTPQDTFILLLGGLLFLITFMFLKKTK